MGGIWWGMRRLGMWRWGGWVGWGGGWGVWGGWGVILGVGGIVIIGFMFECGRVKVGVGGGLYEVFFLEMVWCLRVGYFMSDGLMCLY